MYYDSMIAKLIVHARDRNQAIAKLREALNGFVIRGISSNIPFQAALLAHPKFVAGDFNTGFIAEHYAKGFRAEDVPHGDPLSCRAGRLVHRRLPRSAPPASAASCPATVSRWERIRRRGAGGRNATPSTTPVSRSTRRQAAPVWWRGRAAAIAIELDSQLRRST